MAVRRVKKVEEAAAALRDVRIGVFVDGHGDGCIDFIGWLMLMGWRAGSLPVRYSSVPVRGRRDGLENFRLRVFRAVAGEMSFRKAAEMLRLSQPAVSQHIRLLEEEAGVRLFDRARGEGHGVRSR